MDFQSHDLSSIPISLVSFVVGGLVCFFGFKLLKVVLGLVGFSCGAAAAAGFMVFFAPEAVTATWVLTVIAGIAGAALLIWAFKIGVFCVGAVSGVLVGGFVGTWLSGLSGLAEVAVIVVLAVAGGVLALKLQRIMLGTSTALIGAAIMVVGGLATIIGLDQTETLLKGATTGGALGHAGWIAALAWVLLATAGIGVQLGPGRKKGKKS